jgi:hypothetical protein
VAVKEAMGIFFNLIWGAHSTNAYIVSILNPTNANIVGRREYMDAISKRYILY